MQSVIGPPFFIRFPGWGFLALSSTLFQAALIFCIIGASLIAPIAKAQTINPNAPPPLPTIVDQNGVNLQTGGIQINGPTVSVGQPGRGGMSYTPVSETGAWTSNLVPAITYNPWDLSTLTVTYRNINSVFVSYSPTSGDGASLSHSGTTYTFTAHDGTVIIFQDVWSTFPCWFADPSCTIGIGTSVILPSGEVLTYTYLTSGGRISALNSINSSLGYQLKYNNSCSGCLLAVSAVNNAVNYCDPTGTSCPGTWPTMIHSVSGGGSYPRTATVTDALGNVTTNAEYWSPSVIYRQTVTQPSGRYIQMTVLYNDGMGHIQESVTNGSDTWAYEIVPGTSGLTTTITDPEGRVRVVVSDPATGRIASDTLDPSGLNLKTQYGWGYMGVLYQVIYPEGNYVIQTQDSRGNIVQVDQVGKPGSGISTITTHATYPTCTSGNSLICNQPDTTTDANGNVTNYTYDPAHGGVLTVTGPADSGGVHPQTRYTYDAKYAWYKTASPGPLWGTAVWNSFNWTAANTQAAAPIYVLTQVSQCLSGSSCTGTADEQLTTTAYVAGNSGTPTNLLPASTTVSAGNGSIAATVSTTYDDYSNPISVTGPISGSTTVSFYDLDRRVYGTVSPDPTGSGAYPAVRTTYDVDSRVTEVERGTTPGQSISNWSSFSSLTQGTIGYDAYSGLKNKDTAAIGGTTQSVTQYSYNSAGLLRCTAVRQNSSVFGSLPSDACTLSTTSSTYGPDQITRNSYDNALRLFSKQSGYATGSPITEVTNAFTANSKLDYVEDANGNRTAFTYDGLDRLIQANFPSKTVPHTTSSSDFEQFAYDGNGNLTAKRLRTTETIAYQYDALNRQTLMDLPGGSSQDVYMDYDLLGNLLYAHYGSAGGSGVNYAYDALSRKTSETSYGRTVSSQYDAAGNRTRLTYPDGNYIQYSYDILNRMYQVKQNGSTLLAQYAYDSLDRETGITRGNSNNTSMSYNSSSTDWSLTHAGSTQTVVFAMSYSPAGQLYQRTISNSAYRYGASSLSNNYSPNGLNQYDSVAGNSYSYDGRGNLTSNSVRGLNYNLQNQLTSTSSVSPAVAVAYDPAGRLNQTTVSSTTETFLYDGANLIAEYDSSGNCLRRFVPGQGVDETLVWYEGAGLSTPNWINTDQQGSVVATTDSSGTASTYIYSATGEPTNWAGPRFRYTGQVAIPELALYYYKARFYDPHLGRFLQTDPAGYSDGLNLYAYVRNDPVNASDPSGMIGDCVRHVSYIGPDGLSVEGAEGCGGDVLHYRFVDNREQPNLGSDSREDASTRNGTNAHACTVQPTQSGDWRAASRAAATMTWQFFSGTGPSDLTYGPNSPVSREMAQSGGVASALNLYNSQNQLNGVYVFGAHGYFTEGANPVSQFVGSFTWSVADARGGINLSLSNYSSVSSLMDHMMSSHNRPGAMGTTHQTYNIFVPCH